MKNFMKNFKEYWQKLKGAKTFGEIAALTPNSYVEALAAAPAFLFLLACFHHLMATVWNMITVGDISSFMMMRQYKTAQYLSFIAGGVALALYAAKNGGFKQSAKRCFGSRLSVWLYAAFAVLVTVSPFITGFTFDTFKGPESNVTVVLFIAAYLAPMMTVRSDKAIKTVFYAYTVYGMLLGIEAIVRHLLGLEMCVGAQAIYTNSNHYGYALSVLLTLSSALVVYEKNKGLKILAAAAFAVNSAASAMCLCRGSALGYLVACVFLFIAHKIAFGKFNWANLLMPAAYLLICFLISLKYEAILTRFVMIFTDISTVVGEEEGLEYAGSGRIGMWRDIWGEIVKKPLFGYGTGGTDDFLMAAYNGEYKPHNEFLEYAAAYGIPASLCYFGGGLGIFLRSLRLKNRLNSYRMCILAVVMGYLVSSFFGNVKYQTSPFLFIFAGLALSLKEDGN